MPSPHSKLGIGLVAPSGSRAPMPDILTVNAESRGDALAVVVDASCGGIESVTTYGDFNLMVNRLAHGLVALGCTPGDRVVWCGPNSLEVLTVINAARKVGMIAVPLSYRFTADEMQFVIDNSNARVVVIDAELAPHVAEVRDRLPEVREVVVFGGTAPSGCVAWDDLLARSPEGEPDALDAASPVGGSMIYTSGTTGKPKGAKRRGTHVDTVLALIRELRLRPAEEVYLTIGPLYHSGPLLMQTLTQLVGGCVVTMRKFDPGAWLRGVAVHRATNTFTAPTQLKRIVSLPQDELARADMSSMRVLVANAAPVPYALKQEVVEKLGDGFLFEVYGATELGVVSVLPPEDQLRKPGSCGRTYGPVEVQVVGDDGNPAAVGEPGELFVRTHLRMEGYHRTDERLAQLEDTAWSSVGDVAYRDDDGYLYICDRKKDMIISGGVNIYPAEIEAVLHEYPDVFDAAVLGVPDDEWGESVHAIVQPRPGATIDLEALAQFVGDRLAGYKRPRTYEVRSELPRTESGKLLKRLLRDELWADRSRQV